MKHTSACKDDDVDDVDVGNIYLMVAVHISSCVITITAQNDVNDSIDVGDVHLAITIHVAIQHIYFPCKIARIAWAAINVSIGNIHMVLIISCTLTSNKIGAAIKQVVGYNHGVSRPIIANIYSFQAITAFEHFVHSPYFRGIKTAQVESSQ